VNQSAPLETGLPVSEILCSAIESDRQYFELGAQIDVLEGAQIAWLPGQAHNPAAVVVHRVDPVAAARVGNQWIQPLEARLRDIGTPVSRIYLDGPDTALDTVLQDAGYRAQHEIAFHGIARRSESLKIDVRPVRTAEDWEEKLRFHVANAERPDGHATCAHDWVAMERARCATGTMEAWLCQHDGAVVGTIGTMRVSGVTRLKNLVIDRAARRQGVGRASVLRICQTVAQSDRSDFVVFALDGHAGDALYRAAGFRPVGCQVEWTRAL